MTGLRVDVHHRSGWSFKAIREGSYILQNHPIGNFLLNILWFTDINQRTFFYFQAKASIAVQFSKDTTD